LNSTSSIPNERSVDINTCVLFTKQFPFGEKESYLFSEIPYLLKSFKRVVIVPYDEFQYKTDKNRLRHHPEVEVFDINKRLPVFSAKQKVQREKAVVSALIYELQGGRSASGHLKRMHEIGGQLRQLYALGMSLSEWMNRQSLDGNNTVFYHYWMHRGLVATRFFREISGKSVNNITRAHAHDLYHADWDAEVDGGGGFLAFEHLKWKEAKSVHVISTHGYNYLSSVFPDRKSKLVISRLGVADPGEPIYKAFDGVRTIVTCAFVLDRKRLYLMPDLLKRIAGPVKWVHFGGGPEEDLRILADSVAAAHGAFAFENRGTTPNHEIIDFYLKHRVDLFCNISRAEGIPVALMEASAFGIPMLATETVGNPEIVSSDNGLLIPIQFDAQTVADQINKVFADEAIWMAKSKASRNTYEQLYSAPKNYTKFCEDLKRF
jgi:colanic acid/amylovoran biosynthesis glycosyltransferase